MKSIPRKSARSSKSKRAKVRNTSPSGAVLHKAPTGIEGLDQIVGGGLPKGRPTLICGGPGCGKTLLSMEFIVRGALQYGEPGVFMSFEESSKELRQNVASLGYNLDDLVARKKIALDWVKVERSEIEETGEYDLSGLFIRLNYAIESVGAKRVVLDTIESLFAGLSNTSILRAELRRLFRWLKDKGVTAIITGERGDANLTRQGLEEYVSDCVILLDHRVQEQISTRRLRVVKYRGSAHGTNEYPFLIDGAGITVLPVTSINLNHKAPTQRVSSGVPELDTMLTGGGFYRGSSVLISGTAGVGKTSTAAHFAEAACNRGEKCLYFAFEESPEQIIRNMKSIGVDLGRHVGTGNLLLNAARPTLYGLETHLATMYNAVRLANPDVVVVDPVSNLVGSGSDREVKLMLLRLVDYMKSKQITALFTNLTIRAEVEATELGISSLMDTWLLLKDVEVDGERNRTLHLLKSRGMAHSNQTREFLLTKNGVKLLDLYVGPRGVLTGSARLNMEAQEKAEAMERRNTIRRMEQQVAAKDKARDANIARIKADFEKDEAELEQLISMEKQKGSQLAADLASMATSRKASRQQKKGGK